MGKNNAPKFRIGETVFVKLSSICYRWLNSQTVVADEEFSKKLMIVTEMSVHMGGCWRYTVRSDFEPESGDFIHFYRADEEVLEKRSGSVAALQCGCTSADRPVIHTVSNMKGEALSYQAECLGCGMRSRQYGTLANAVTFWNRMVIMMNKY
jgi:hypothetical protein